MAAVEQASREERLAEQGIDIQAMMDDAITGARIDEISERDDDPSIDELRDILGPDAEGLSDEQIQTAWTKSKEEQNQPEEKTPSSDTSEKAPISDTVEKSTPSGWQRPWAVSGDEKNAVGSTLVDKKFKFPVDGKDAELTVDQLIRNSQRLPSEQRQLAEVRQQRNEAAKQLDEVKQKVAGLETDRKTWLWALEDPTGARFLKLLEKHQENLSKAGPEVAAAEDASAPTREDELQGELVYQQSIVPELQKLARSYGWSGASPDAGSIAHLDGEINKVARHLIAAEGNFITPQRVQQILAYDIPNMLIEAGWTSGGAVAGGHASAPAGGSSVDPERKKLIAENQNLKNQLAKQRVNDAPDAGTGSVPGSVSNVPNLENAKSWREIKAALRDPNSFQS